jgi:hypothetical protein
VEAGSGELVTSDESTVIAKPFLDPIVVEDGQCDGCLSDPSGTDEGNGLEVFSETDDLLNQFVAPKNGSRWWGWRFSVNARCKTSDTGFTDGPKFKPGLSLDNGQESFIIDYSTMKTAQQSLTGTN